MPRWRSNFWHLWEIQNYYIKGNDKATGLPTEWNESRATEIAEELLSWPQIQGARTGLQMSASVQLNGLGEPIATWYAFDSELTNRGGFGPIGGSDGIQYDEISDGNVVINEELADNIEASIGDVIEIHWVEVDLIEGLVRSETNLTVQYIVSDVNTGIEIVGNLFCSPVYLRLKTSQVRKTLSHT